MTARSEAFKEMQVPDMERRLADMVRLGTVEDQDYSDPAAPRIKVRYGKNVTGWLPWTVASASGDSDWEPLDKGTQVIMAAPSGDLAQAVVLGAIHQAKHAAFSQDPDERGRVWKDGARDTYNRNTHQRVIDVPEGGRIVLSIGGTLYELTAQGATLKAPQITFDTPHAHFTGEVTSDGDQIAQGVSQVHHKHGESMPGPGTTGEPIK